MNRDSENVNSVSDFLLGPPEPIPSSPDLAEENPPVMNSAGGAHCSLETWHKFLKIHMDGYNTSADGFLKAKTFKKLHAPVPDQNYAVGAWLFDVVQGSLTLRHSGNNLSNTASAWLRPSEGDIIVLATNMHWPRIIDVHTQMLEAIIDAKRK